MLATCGGLIPKNFLDMPDITGTAMKNTTPITNKMVEMVCAVFCWSHSACVPHSQLALSKTQQISQAALVLHLSLIVRDLHRTRTRTCKEPGPQRRPGRRPRQRIGSRLASRTRFGRSCSVAYLYIISAGQIQTTDRLVARAGSLQPHDSLLVLCRKIPYSRKRIGRVKH